MRLDDDGSCAAPRPLTCVFSTNETACARGEAHCRWLEKQARMSYSPRAPLACGLGAPSEAFSI